jgi:hypothetical protein
LTALGHTVSVVDTSPLFARGASIDDAVDALARALRDGGVCAPPLAVAHGADAVLAQKFLESFPLAGGALLSPLPPAPRAWVETLAADALSRRGAIADALRARGLARGAVRAAAGEGLLAALSLDPVRLEPQPVPLLVLRARGDAWDSDEGAAATAAAHALPPEQVLPPATPTRLRESLAAWVAARF